MERLLLHGKEFVCGVEDIVHGDFVDEVAGGCGRREVGVFEDAVVWVRDWQPFVGGRPGWSDDDGGKLHGTGYVEGAGVEHDAEVATLQDGGELLDGGVTGEGCGWEAD